jgi:hypothetical protein
MSNLESQKMENFADGRQEKGMEGLRSQGDVKKQRLEERRREAARYRDAYLYFLNRRRLEEQRSAEGLTDDQRKQWRIGKDHIDDQSNQWQIEKDHIDDPSKQRQIEQDYIDHHRKLQQFREDLAQRVPQRIGEDPDQIRQWQREKIFTEKIIQLLQNDVVGQVLEGNKDRAINKGKFEGTDEQEKADSATPKNPSRSKNPNPSDPSLDRISTEQQDSTTSKDRSFSPDFKTSTREGTNPADQATSHEKSKFVHGFDQNDSKSLGSDTTTPFDAQKSTDQQSAKAAQKFSSTDDLYKNEEALKVIRAFFESKEGKIMLEIEHDFARMQKEFFESGAARVDSEKVGIDNPQKIMKSMQREIDEYRLRLANVIDPKLVQLGEVQEEEYYRCLKDLERHLKTANNYMRNMINVTKSKTNFSSNTPQWSTPPLVHAVA